MGPSVLATSVAALVARAAESTPSPAPIAPGVEPDLVTPGVIGFAITALFIVLVILLVIDMTRRMRRVRYRAEARERIAEELEAQGQDAAKPE